MNATIQSLARGLTVLAALAVLCTNDAWATVICVKITPDFDDAGLASDDYITSNDIVPAYGLRIKLVNLNTAVSTYHYLSESSGCLTILGLGTDPYDVWFYSKAFANGNYIEVWPTDTSTNFYTAAAFYQTLTSGTKNYTLGPHRGWNTLVAATWAIKRRTAGLSGETFTFYNENCPTGPGNCRPIGEDHAYIDSDRKYATTHEMGHLVAYKVSGVDANYTYSTNEGNCITTPGTNHELTSKESNAAAAAEGFAQYYSTVAFNDTSEPDCAFTYSKNQDFDHDGDLDDRLDVNCSGPPDSTNAPTVDGADYLGDVCTGTLTNRATEFDYLRFLWDQDYANGMDVAMLFDIYSDSTPQWWDIYLGLTAADFLWLGADYNGLASEWEDYDVVNGIHR